MKSILLSVKPNEVCKILNGEQTLIVRKRFPKDYQGWVYIYCTKGKPQLGSHIESGKRVYTNLGTLGNTNYYNGKVVARFYCETLHNTKLECSDINGLLKKFGNSPSFLKLSNLEVFDKPKELGEFKRRNDLSFYQWNAGFDTYSPITKAPQNYCYIENEE